MNTIENEIRKAIDRSVSHAECVSITVETTINEVMSAIEVVTDAEVDYVKNDGSYDVWGWTDSTADQEHDWRLSVICGKLTDGIYILWPEGSGWVSVTVEDGQFVGKFEESEYQTHVTAGDRFSNSGPSDDDVNVNDPRVLKMIGDYCGYDYLGCVLEFRQSTN